jgi:hypothetical protein
MKKVSMFFLSLIFAGSGLTIAPKEVSAQGVFNGRIANPFVFCSLPKPCKKCQPFRSIWEQICPAGTPSAAQTAIANQAAAELAKTDPKLVQDMMTKEIFWDQMTNVNRSAFYDVTSQTEIVNFINWWGQQPAPKNSGFGVRTMFELWCRQGVVNPQSNPTLINTAVATIDKTNLKIVESLSNGIVPPTNLKPWFNVSQNTNYCPDQNNYGN